jgi:hypothetical protein
MSEIERFPELPVENVLMQDRTSGQAFTIPRWSVPLADKMHIEDLAAIADLFTSLEDYLGALDAASADARLGINLPQRLSDPTPLDAPHYRMQEALHRMLPLARARHAREYGEPSNDDSW